MYYTDRSYRDKLKDPRWQKRKCEILMRDNFTCQKCGATDKTLEVHHITYSGCINGDPWASPDSDLVTWCHDCHHEYHFVDNQQFFHETYLEFFPKLVKMLILIEETYDRTECSKLEDLFKRFGFEKKIYKSGPNSEYLYWTLSHLGRAIEDWNNKVYIKKDE